ncbi:MAG: hypothetical protein H6672_14040 [Anaerolineaceae bacterium]|nr:hypothetical protein [Anaerolineaceae bacterium]
MSEPTELCVIGHVAKSVIHSLRYDETLKTILDTYTPELRTLGDMDWYPVSRIITALEKIVEVKSVYDASFDMIAIGMAVAAHIPLTNESTFEEYLHGLYANIRKVYNDLGKSYAKAEKIENQHFRIEFNLPWPDDLMYGNYYGHAKRLLPPRTRFMLSKTRSQKPSVFYVRWF